MKLKQNWSLKVNKDNSEAYKQTLIAFGYTWSDLCTGHNGHGYIRTDAANSNRVFFSGMTGKDHFDRIEDFLKWSFLQETPKQRQLRELQETIQKAQEQIEKLQNE